MTQDRIPPHIPPDKPLHGRRALVVGASGGLGSAIARSLASQGCAVALGGREPHGLTRLADRIASETGIEAYAVPLDLRDHAGIASAVHIAVESMKGLDVLVNAAGQVAGGRFEQTSVDQWRESIEVKLLGTIEVIRHALPQLRRSRGTVITLTGLYGREPSATQIISGGINAALTNLHKALAIDLAPDGVRVLSLCIGGFLTQRLDAIVEQLAQANGRSLQDELAIQQAQLPMQRYGDPGELAQLVAFLASPSCTYLTGASIVVDGGASHGI